MRRRALLLALPLLLASCSDSPDEATPGPTPTPSASAGATAEDPFEAIAPPTSPGVGSFPPLLANRAYAAARGLLALQLLEQPTLTGANEQELITQLSGETQDVTIARDLGAKPTRAGLDLRPRLPEGATVPKPVGEVTASSYVGEQVQGQAGEVGLRVTWTGTVVYPVTLKGKTSDVTYSLKVGYVFSGTPNDPAGLVMQQLVRGSAEATGVVTACLDKGVLYPGDAAASCPV